MFAFVDFYTDFYFVLPTVTFSFHNHMKNKTKKPQLLKAAAVPIAAQSP